MCCLHIMNVTYTILKCTSGYKELEKVGMDSYILGVEKIDELVHGVYHTDLLPPLTSTINSLQADVVDLKAKSGNELNKIMSICVFVFLFLWVSGFIMRAYECIHLL